MVAKNIYRNRYLDTHRGFTTGLWHILKLWRGSVFKIIWFEALIFLALYTVISVTYQCILFDIPKYRHTFEVMCVYMGRFSNVIPITFICGFYVSQVVSRWWDQFMSLPWPDKLGLRLITYCFGKDYFMKNLRKTVMRYMNLSSILVFRLISKKVHKRFPDYQSLIDAKLLLPHEMERLRKADAKTPHETTWVPILWSLKLLQKARTEGKYTCEAPMFNGLIDKFDQIETCNRKILNYGWITFPLAYTQVVTFIVYMYFFAALFGRQALYPSSADKAVDHHSELFPDSALFYSTLTPFAGHTPIIYFPLFTIMELFCYVGWIKVAATLLNPFGEDDEDFKINYLIDRNLQVSYLIVDEADAELELAEDPFQEAGISIPPDLPYQKNDKPDLNLESTGNGPILFGALDSLRKNSLSVLSFYRSRSRSLHASVEGGLHSDPESPARKRSEPCMGSAKPASHSAAATAPNSSKGSLLDVRMRIAEMDEDYDIDYNLDVETDPRGARDPEADGLAETEQLLKDSQVRENVKIVPAK